MRLIDADGLKEEIGSWRMNDYEPADFIDAIDNAQTVSEITNEDVQNAIKLGFHDGYEMAKAKNERPQGEWISRETDGTLYPFWERYECSVCKACGSCNDNFCPNCGADMKGGTK